MKKDKDNSIPRRRSTFAVLFYINRTKVRKDGTCQLLCKVSIDAEWEQIGTKVSVNPDIWNPEKGRADGRSANAVTVNRAIDSLTVQITEHYEEIKRTLGFVTAELVKNAMKGIGRKPSTLLALFREHNEEFHKRVGVDRTKESYESYLNSYSHLSAFVSRKRDMKDIPLRSLDKSFYDDFEMFLCSDRGLKPKSVHEHLYRLKKMTMRAVSQGTLRRDPYARLHPPLPRRKSRHMKFEDLKLLMEKQIDAQIFRGYAIGSSSPPLQNLHMRILNACQRLTYHRLLTAHGGYMSTGKKQEAARQYACLISPCESWKNTGMRGRTAKSSTCIADTT